MQVIHYINPNFHVALIHFPIALLCIGLLIEIFSFLWRGSSVRVAAKWMIFLGALLTAPAVTSGIYAKADVFNKMGGLQGDWMDTRSSANLSPEQWKLINAHVLWSSVGSAIAILTVILWLGGTDQSRRRFYVPALVLLI